MALQIGSWGLPELGITEKIGSLMGVPTQTNQTGGSNLFGSYQVTPQEQGTINYVNQTSSNGVVPYKSGQNLTRVGSQTTSGTTGTTGSGQVLGSSDNGGGQDPNQALWAEIDNIYNQSMGYANSAESTLRSNQPTVEADIQGQYQSAVKGAETQKAIGDRELQGSATEAGTRQEDALTAGRRLYNELMMGGQQRFGGASSAGEAYGELTAREFQRGQAGTRNAFQNAMTKITELKSNLQDKFSSAVYNLEQQKMSAINEAKRAFDEKILEINRMRAEAGQNKSSMRLEMLQNLRNQIYQINLASAQSNTQLAQQKAQQEQILSQLETQASSAATGGQQAVSNLQAQTTTNPTTQLAINTPQQSTPQTYTGRRKDEEMTGYALPKREDLYA